MVTTGLGVVSTEVVNWQVEITLVLLGLLFLSQSFGSSKIGVSFGPIMLVWFISIGGNCVTWELFPN